MAFRTYLLIGVLLCSAVSQAQIQIPAFDVELKIHQNLIPGGGQNEGEMTFVETTNFYGGAHIQINQYVAIGGFYSRSFRGIGGFSQGDSEITQKVLQLQKGLDVRLSTGRAKKWRYYLTASYSQIELVMVQESFRLAQKTNAVGFNLGIMRKLSNNLYLNVIELGPTLMSDEIFWFNRNDKGILNAKMGLTYNIGKKK